MRLHKTLSIKDLFVLILFVLITTIFFIKTEHLENQGFSPTDDGVILAQSWRIINGEIAHKDFISIRPAGSGILHSIHFYSPLPLMISARWFVLFQFVIISFVISLITKYLYEKEYGKKLNILFFLSLFMVCFSLSSLNYNVYPWTTIDAVFWIVLAMPFILLKSRSLWVIAGLLFVSFAALSRQNFAILSLIAFIYVFYKNINNPVKAVFICLTGAIPFFLYLIMLIKHGAVDLFIGQITGQTELLETGLIQYIKRFILSYTGALNLICLFICGLLYFKKQSLLKQIFIEKGFHSVVSVIYAFIALIHIVRYFLLDYADIFVMPFELFFMLGVISLLNFVVTGKFTLIHFYVIIVLFISWVSSISLGANTPVFATGLLISAFILIIADFQLRYPVKLSKILQSRIIIICISLIIFVLTVYSQRQVNYRDLGHKKITEGLDYVSEEFGKIRTNPRTLAYYSDLADIYNSLPDSKNNTVVIPNNAVFYPIMKIRNPAVLDWIQPEEYSGQEKRLFEEIDYLISNNEITYFILDKVDSKRLHEGSFPVFYNESHITHTIIANCKEIKVNSDFFMVFKTKKSNF